MFTKYASIVSVADVEGYNRGKDKFPSFIQNNEKVMQRVAAITPITLDPDRFLYMRTRLVSSVEKHGPNANGDAFEHEELAARTPTFVRAAVNLDHDNDAPEKAIGFILDAIYKAAKIDMFAEGIHAIDKMLAEAKRKNLIPDIENGVVTDTSMGCFVESSLCSECLREAGWNGKFDVEKPQEINQYVAMLKPGKGIASVPEQYCRHIGKFGEKKGGLGGPYEINRNVTFFEDSIITTAGADPKAKYLNKIAQLKPSDWTKYLICRTLDNGVVVEARQKLKGDDEMNKLAETELGKKDDVAREDRGDTNSGHDKYQEQLKESKGKSDTKDDSTKGSDLSTGEGKGDYALAAKKTLDAIAQVKALYKHDPKAVEALLFDKEAADSCKLCGDNKNPIDKEGFCEKCNNRSFQDKQQGKVGGKKQADAINDDEDDSKDLKKEVKDTISKEEAVKPDTKIGKKKSFMEQIIAGVTAAILGNQVDTQEDKGDGYGSGHEKYDAQFKESKGTSDSKDDDLKGNQNMTQEGKKDYPLGKSASKKVAEDKVNLETLKTDKVEEPEVKEGEQVRDKSQEGDGMSKQRISGIVDKLAKGAKFDEAIEKVASKDKESREARRKRLMADTEDLNRGSMGSGGTERDADDEQDPEDKLKDFHEKVEAPVTDKVEKMEEKAVASKKKIAIDADAEVAKGNEETKDQTKIKEDSGRKVGGKKVADGEERDIDAVETHVPTAKENEMANSQDSNVAEGAAPEFGDFDKSHKEENPDEMDKAKNMVDTMDEKEASLRKLIQAKKLRAEVMAKAGYRTAAMSHISGIDLLEKHAEELLNKADKAASLIEGVEKLDASKQAAVKDSIFNILKRANLQFIAIHKTLKEMRTADLAKEETYLASKKVLEAEQRAEVAEKKAITAGSRVQEMVKSKLINETIKLGSIKGVVTASNKGSMIEKLSEMTEVQFEATRSAWRELPDQTRTASREYVDSITREGAKQPKGLGELAEKTAADQDVDGLDDPKFFN